MPSDALSLLGFALIFGSLAFGTVCELWHQTLSGPILKRAKELVGPSGQVFPGGRPAGFKSFAALARDPRFASDPEMQRLARAQHNSRQLLFCAFGGLGLGVVLLAWLGRLPSGPG